MSATQTIRLAVAAMTCGTGIATFGSSTGGTLGSLLIAAGGLLSGVGILGGGISLLLAR